MAIPGGRRWVFFDLGGTLLNLKPDIYQGWAKEISKRNGRAIGEEELTRAIDEEWQDPARSGDKLHSADGQDDEEAFLQALYRAVLVRLGHPEASTPGADDRWDRVVATMAEQTMDPESFDWRAGMQDVVNQLREQGVSMGIISNAFASVRKLLDRFQLQDVFDPIVLSCEERTAKPGRRIFTIALQRAAARPQQACFVDDRPDCRRAAARVGMHSLPPEAARIEQYILLGERQRRTARPTPVRYRRPRRAACASANALGLPSASRVER